MKPYPDILLSNAKIADEIHRAVKRRELVKLGSRLYSPHTTEPKEEIVKRNIWKIVGLIFPGAVITDRTGFEIPPAKEGSLFLVAPQRTKHLKIALPGICIYARPGHRALPSDKAFMGNLFLASPARLFLENMKPSRARSSALSRTLSRGELEERLEMELVRGGEASLNKLRDEARQISRELGLEQEYKQLDVLIGAFLGTKKTTLNSVVGLSRQRGYPFDPQRIRLFERLLHELQQNSETIRKHQSTGQVLPFFEAYFSNFIEGTEFEIEEAKEIIFQGKIPQFKPQDAHDIKGTFAIVSDTKKITQTPKSAEEFLTLLRTRHAEIMSGRPESLPGQFKQQRNRAGTTTFVEPELVEGTLRQAFPLVDALDSAFARAAMMMFVVSEVHPFADGNGRTARIFMNSELVSLHQCRIIVPTVYRNNYISALKALSQAGEPDALIRVLDFAQRFTLAIDWSSFESAEAQLKQGNAFLDANEADRTGVRLRIPQ